MTEGQINYLFEYLDETYTNGWNDGLNDDNKDDKDLNEDVNPIYSFDINAFNILGYRGNYIIQEVNENVGCHVPILEDCMVCAERLSQAIYQAEGCEDKGDYINFENEANILPRIKMEIAEERADIALMMWSISGFVTFSWLDYNNREPCGPQGSNN